MADKWKFQMHKGTSKNAKNNELKSALKTKEGNVKKIHSTLSLIKLLYKRFFFIEKSKDAVSRD